MGLLQVECRPKAAHTLPISDPNLFQLRPLALPRLICCVQLTVGTKSGCQCRLSDAHCRHPVQSIFIDCCCRASNGHSVRPGVSCSSITSGVRSVNRPLRPAKCAANLCLCASCVQSTRHQIPVVSCAYAPSRSCDLVARSIGRARVHSALLPCWTNNRPPRPPD